VDGRKGRHYDFDGKKYPSVTTILGVLNKPALIGWAAKEERKLLSFALAEHFDQAKEVMGDALASLSGKEFVEQAITKIGDARAHQKKLREAADIGTQVHKWIEWDIKMMLAHDETNPANSPDKTAKLDGEEPTITHDKAKESQKKYLAWKESVRMEPLSTEMQIVSHVHKYAGTEDIRLRIWPPATDPLWAIVPGRFYTEEGGMIVTGDFKTGKSVYGEAFLQNAAYRLAEQEMGIVPKSDAGIIIRLPKEESDPEFEVVAVPPLEELVPTFIALRHGVWPWVQADDERYERLRKEKNERAKAA
jgi:hypothetical protein